jgi:hypothetical protein
MIVNNISGPSFITISPQFATGSSNWSSDVNDNLNGQGSEFNNTLLEHSNFESNIHLNIISDWWTSYPINSPPPRNDAAYASMNKYILLFGGINGGFLNDTWLYTIDNSTWMQIFPPISPSPRFGSGMAGLWNEDKFILFGGESQQSHCSDTWIFDIENKEWSLINPSYSPSNRSYATMAPFYNSESTLLVGGSDQPNSMLCDTWVFDGNSCQWRLSESNNQPSMRYGFAMAPIITEDKIVLFGGGSPYPVNDTWIYDLSDDNWSLVLANISPPCRMAHSMAPIGNYGNVLMFGGSNQDTGYNDTWIYNSSIKQWIELFPVHSPPRAIYTYMISLQNATNVILIDKSNNIFWTFHQASYNRLGYFYSPYINAGYSSDFITIHWSASIPPGTNLTFQLRTADNITILNTKPFVGPNNSTITFYNQSNSQIDLIHYEDSIIQYKALFRTSNPDLSPLLYAVNIDYDMLPHPPTILYPKNGTWLNKSNPEFHWLPNDTDSAAMNAFEWQMHRWSSESGWLEYTSGEIISNASSYIPKNPIEDGICYWRVRTQDIEGNWGPFSEYQKFGVDTVPPKPITAQIIPNRWTNGQCRLFFSTKDDLSGMNNYTIFLDGQSIGAQMSPLTVPDLPDGAHQIIIRAYDKAGNYAESTVRALIDRGKPEPFLPLINPPNWTNSSPQLIFETNDSGSGISHYEIEIDGKGFFIGNSPFTLPDLMDGMHTLLVRAFDLAGNYQDESIDAYMDKTPPGDFIISIEPNGWTKENPTITFNAIDITSNIDHFELNVNNATFTCQSSPFTLNNLPEGINTITVRAYDKAVNFIDVQTQAFIDRSPPDAFVPISSEKNWTKTPPSISFLTNDGVSGIDHYELKIDDEPFLKRESPFTLPRLPDGPHNITVRAFDSADNFIDGNTIIYLDISPPIWKSLKIDQGLKTADSENVILSLSAIDNTSGLDQMCFSNDGIEYSPWEPFATTKSWKLASGFGERTVYVKVKDHAGNEGTPESARIMKEATNQWLLPVSILILMVSSIIIGYRAFRYIKSRN